MGKYKVQAVEYGRLKTHRVLQNEGGPCPLIGIFNTLLLRGNVTLGSMQFTITFEQMIEHIKTYFQRELQRQSFSNVDAERTANVIKNYEDASKFFPKLEKGLDINVRFDEPDAFEFTSQVAMFDLYNIRLFHVWCVDPQHKALEWVRKQTYNELTSFILSEPPDDLKDQEVELAILEQKKDLARTFLKDTSGQLTAHGLFRLHEKIREDELCILFRNNHFATIVKHNKKLYSLVTDEGLCLENPRVFWQSLQTLDGDDCFLASDFLPLDAIRWKPQIPVAPVQSSAQNPNDPSFVQQQQRALNYYKKKNTKAKRKSKDKNCAIM